MASLATTRSAVLFSVLLAGVFSGQVHALSVDLIIVDHDLCSWGIGSMEAAATGGQEPYTYDWYEVSSGDIPLCIGCSAVQGGMADMVIYKVVVTDALGATAEAVMYMQALTAISIQNVQSLPYLAGAVPVIGFELLTDAPYFEPLIDVSGAVGQPVGGAYLRVPIAPGVTNGTIVAGNDINGSVCWDEATYTIGPPTVMPAISVVESVGSCASVPTGEVTVRFTDGVVPAWLNIYRRHATEQDRTWTGQLNPLNAGPEVLHTMGGLAPGEHWLILSGEGQLFDYDMPGFPYTCADSISFTIPDLGPTCGVVTGTVFLDNNQNCTQQGSEPGIPGTVLEVLPGPYYATTNSGGGYDLVLPNGSYTIREQSAQVDEHCTEVPIPFMVNGGTVTVHHPTVPLVPMDMRIAMSSGPARPGFELQYGINVRNLTVGNTGNVTVTVQLDPALGYLSASPAPNSIAGGTLAWSFPPMPVHQERSISLRTQVPADVGLLGTGLATTASVSTVLTDGDPTNNKFAHMVTVTGSYDPNDKLAATTLGSGASTGYDPAVDEWIDYTIRFQNTGTDTAFHVWITDTLQAGLDPATIRMGAASHASTWELRGQGTLKFKFANIQLPDSNVNEPRSHGFVSFRIKPRAGYLVASGDQVSNTANIFFDFNPPVITDPCVLQVPQPGVLLNVRMLLVGVDGAGDGLMSDALRAQGLLPLHEPYTAAGYVHAGGGGAVIAPPVLAMTGNNAIVDWVVVELRDPVHASTVVRTASALLQRDGDVVALDGVSPLQLPVSAGSYFVAVRHRNHLGVMTASPIPLNRSVPTAVDFTTASTATHGTDARGNVNGTMVLWPGDVTGDGVTKYTGADNDRDPILRAVGGSVPTNVIHGVYDVHDVNLDGRLMYTGAGNDRDMILQTVGGAVPTAVRRQQLP